MKNKIDLIKFIKMWGIFFLISLAFILISLEIYGDYSTFQEHAVEMRADYTKMQKKMIKREVLRVVEMINYKTKNISDQDESRIKDLLATISRIKLQDDGYIFINEFNGNALLANGKLITEKKKLWEVFNKNPKKIMDIFTIEKKAALRQDGGYIYYSINKPSNPNKVSPKVSFVKSIPNRKWIVGTGVYLDNVEKEIATMKSNLSHTIFVKIGYSVIIVIVVLVLFLILFKKLLNNFNQNLNKFDLFFKNAVFNNEQIDLTSIKFTQLEVLAKNANKMLQEKTAAQNKLSEEREKLLVTIRSIGDGLITTDKEGKVTLLNSVAENLTGWNTNDAEGKPLNEIFNIVNEFSREQIENPVTRVLIENKAIGLSNHTILISKDGSEYNISDSAAPIKDEENNIHGVVLVFRDVTEEYKTKVELLKSKERYNRLADLTDEGILIHENGIVKDVNSAIEKISGYSSKELLGENFINILFPKEYHAKLLSAMQNPVTTPLEITCAKKDGSIISLEIESREIVQENGESILRVMALRDISKRKENEFEILKLSNALEQTPVSIIITNQEGNIEYVNPKFTEVSGFTSQEVLNKNPIDLFSTDDDDIDYDKLWEIIRSGKVWSGEFHNKKKNGELFWESAIISPIKNSNGEITHFVTVKEDITEKKKMLDELVASKQKAENADKMKSLFLAQMSHEIRTPISAMMSLSSLLRDELEDSVDEDYKLSFDMIGRAGMRIVRTVDLLLNLSEIQAGTYEIINKDFDLYSDILTRIIDEYKKAANDKDILLNINLNTDNTKIVADSYTVDQIFTHLVDNAIKYTPKGKINISVYRDQNARLITEVSDTGIGIGEEYLDDLFTPFSQEDMGYTRKYEGNGIGLTLVKKYCELNNANIEVESKKGEGSTFKVVFQ